MSADLQGIFGSLLRHHIARVEDPLPPPSLGITWLWASNGIWKRGVDQTLDVLICVQPVKTPGLAQLVPHVRWRTHEGRVPGELLTPILEHARRAADGEGILRPVEQQYFITYRTGLPRPFRVAVPEQTVSTTHIAYKMTVPGQILIDLHSHHQMDAFFSETDDRDDRGLSISAVVGHLFDEHPAITVRANVYGHRQSMPALTIFDCLPSGLRDCQGRGRSYANAKS